MKTIILTFLVGVLGYILGVRDNKKNIRNLNSKFRIPKNLPTSYDEFKQEIEENTNIGNIMDVCFRYGFEERQKIEDDNIDKMLMELSGETQTIN